MKLPRRRFLQLTAGAAALPAVSRSASAQTYPSKPITIIVPFAAGGATDTIARVLAERMRASLGQTIIVENATGAGGTIGVGRAARAAPDGYTISLGQNGSHVITGATYSKLPYDLLNDFEPLSLICIAPFVIAAKKAMPANDLKGLIAWLKANPGKASLGNAGVGSITHVSALVFAEATGTRIQYVPYRGNAPAMQDLVAGQIDLMIADPITAMPQVRGGTIKIYGVTANTRLSSAPESRPWTRPDCPDSMSRCGMACGCPRARRSLLSPSSMPLPSRHWPIRPCAPSLPRWARRFSRANGRHRRRWARFKRPTSINGGRS